MPPQENLRFHLSKQCTRKSKRGRKDAASRESVSCNLPVLLRESGPLGQLSPLQPGFLEAIGRAHCGVAARELSCPQLKFKAQASIQRQN